MAAVSLASNPINWQEKADYDDFMGSDEETDPVLHSLRNNTALTSEAADDLIHARAALKNSNLPQEIEGLENTLSACDVQITTLRNEISSLMTSGGDKEKLSAAIAKKSFYECQRNYTVTDLASKKAELSKLQDAVEDAERLASIAKIGRQHILNYIN